MNSHNKKESAVLIFFISEISRMLFKRVFRDCNIVMFGVGKGYDRMQNAGALGARVLFYSL